MHAAVTMLTLAFVFSVPWESAVTVGQIGTLARVMGMAAAGGWILLALVRRSCQRPPPFFLASAVFVLWNCLSYFWSLGKDETLMQIQTYVQLLVMSWIVYDLAADERDYRRFLMAYVIGCYVVVVDTILNFLRGEFAVEPGRYVGANVNAVEMVVILSLGIPIAWFLALNSPRDSLHNKVGLVLHLGYIPLAVFASFLTGSRTALFTLLPGIVYLFSSMRLMAWRTKFILGMLVIGSIYAVSTQIPGVTMSRLMTIGESVADRDLGGRVDLWERSIELIREYPLLGVGSGAFKDYTVYGSVVHNTFLSVFCELGLIGFAIYMAMLAILGREGFRQSRCGQHRSLAMLAIWALGSLSLTWELTKVTWLTFTFVLLATEWLAAPAERLSGKQLRGDGDESE
ncbi:MAG: O-antigen ligase family protein [Desulfobacterales bacterium]|jgi:O-antigen ligase|nr:O-antigen ligase family protein [Desulfobacterales bacterium]